jgi:hypothetical protein
MALSVDLLAVLGLLGGMTTARAIGLRSQSYLRWLSQVAIVAQRASGGGVGYSEHDYDAEI